MQDHGQIARAFAAWQRAHQKLCDAELRLEAATRAHEKGLAPSPDELRRDVASLKAEQDWRYDVAADTLRRKNTRPATDVPSMAARVGLGSAHPA